MAQLDGYTRRRELGEALWRVVLREGIEAASVRKVAAEAGLSKGSLRHVFPSQSELLAFAMRLIVDEVTRRVEAVDATGEIRDVVERKLHTLLVLDPEIARSLVRAHTRNNPLLALSDREREVLGLMAEGRSNAAIAERLVVSGKTVESHIANIFTKLDLHDAPDDHRRVLAVLAALRDNN